MVIPDRCVFYIHFIICSEKNLGIACVVDKGEKHDKNSSILKFLGNFALIVLPAKRPCLFLMLGGHHVGVGN